MGVSFCCLVGNEQQIAPASAGAMGKYQVETRETRLDHLICTHRASTENSIKNGDLRLSVIGAHEIHDICTISRFYTNVKYVVHI
jgi:hypothetical protein